MSDDTPMTRQRLRAEAARQYDAAVQGLYDAVDAWGDARYASGSMAGYPPVSIDATRATCSERYEAIGVAARALVTATAGALVAERVDVP